MTKSITTSVTCLLPEWICPCSAILGPLLGAKNQGTKTIYFKLFNLLNLKSSYWETGENRKNFPLFIHSPNGWTELGQPEDKTQELHSSLSHYCRGPSTWPIIMLPSQHQKWDSWDMNHHQIVALHILALPTLHNGNPLGFFQLYINCVKVSI